MSLSQLDDDLILLRSRLAERERDLAAVREAAADAAEAAVWRLEAARQEAAALRCALDEARAMGAAVEPEPTSAAEISAEIMVAEATPLPPAFPLPVAASAPPRRRPLRRVIALPVWRFIRPVARPALWRARGFLAADSLRELAALRAAQDAMRDAVRDTVREAVQEALSRKAPPSIACAEASCRPSGPSHGLGLGDTAAERWLLTVALEATAAQLA